jgi:hypothetical protein
MAHWFDTLARPHTRRTALKSAGLAGAALLLPIGRTPAADADLNEPCNALCRDRAEAAKEQADEVCAQRFGVRGFGEVGSGGIFTIIRHERGIGCKAEARTRNHTARYRCDHLNDCGDPEQYPNGAPPPVTPVPVTVPNPNCGVGNYVFCGDQPCCDLANATCVSCPTRGQVCCVIGGDCCGTG